MNLFSSWVCVFIVDCHSNNKIAIVPNQVKETAERNQVQAGGWQWVCCTSRSNSTLACLQPCGSHYTVSAPVIHSTGGMISKAKRSSRCSSVKRHNKKRRPRDKTGQFVDVRHWGSEKQRETVTRDARWFGPDFLYTAIRRKNHFLQPWYRVE